MSRSRSRSHGFCGLVDEVQPDTVLTFGPDGGTCHPDHIASGRWTTLACRSVPAPPRLLYSTNTPEWVERFESAVARDDVMMVDVPYPTTPPADLAVRFVADDALTDRKLAVLRSQVSQVEPLVQQAGVDVYRELLREESYREPTADDWPD